MSNVDPNQKPRNGKQTYDSSVSQLKKEITDRQALLDGGVATKNKDVNMLTVQIKLEIEERKEILNELLIPSNKRKFIDQWNKKNKKLKG